MSGRADTGAGDGVRPGPAQQLARVTGYRAHRVGGGVQQVTGIRGGVRLAEPVPAVAVDQGDVHRPLPVGGQAEQVVGVSVPLAPPPMIAMTGRRLRARLAEDIPLA